MKERYLVYRYVCACGEAKPPMATGWQSLQSMFVERPQRCRYVVFETLEGEIHGMDLYKVVVELGGRITPGSTERFPDVDTAVATLSLRYEHP